MAKSRVYSESVHISGLTELRRAMIAGDPVIKKEFRKVMKATAEIVASHARSKVPVLTGSARKSIKAGTSGAAASIRGGSKPGSPRSKAPYFGWLDFGGTISPQGTKIFRDKPKSPGNKWNGRYIYPSIRDNIVAATKYLESQIPQLILKSKNK